MRLRLAAIADASIVLEDPVLPPSPRPAMPETTDVAPVAVAMATAAAVPTAGARPAADEAPASAPRRVWRDASVALFACYARSFVIAVPGAVRVRSGRRGHPGANAAADADRRRRADRSPSPSPSLPLTALARPIASFTCSHRAGLRVAFQDTSETWGKPATYHWDFGGDGSSSAADPKHRFSKPGGYDVSLVVSNSAGRSDAFTLHVHPEHGEGAIDHGRCP